MNQQAQYITSLLLKHLQNNISSDEEAELQAWASASETNAQLFREFSSVEAAAMVVEQRYKYDHAKIDDALRQAFPDVAFGKNMSHGTAIIHRVNFLRTTWFRVAAAILLVAGFGAYLWLQPSTDKAAITTTKPVPEKNDVLPGGNKAVLRLADGSEIMLDSAANGRLAEQAGANIEKTGGGQITYLFNKGSLSRTVSYNTMSTPRGGQYQLALPDGSKVWLNAESSITFPTAFSGNAREVSITGEAYFEITANKEKPFIVNTLMEKITVLGTAFNVNSYPEETAVKTSLLQGAVKIQDKILRPGQAYVNGKVVTTNIEQDMAWRNGVFNFHGMRMKEAMRQIARWYDINIEYRDHTDQIQLGGEIGRQLTLQQLLRGLEQPGLHFELTGKTLLIKK